MVSVAQLVEPRIVIPVVVGSSPIVHPILGPLAQLAEQGTLNPKVVGSTPTRPTIQQRSILGTWVTDYTGDIGNSFGIKGLSAGSTRPTSSSK